MNPIIMSQVATGAKKIFTNKYVVIAIIIVVVIFLAKGGIKKISKKIKEKKFDRDETKDVNQLAQQYRSASNPSGNNWMINWDGTDEDAIERLAYQTKGVLTQVADAYKLKFDETLTDRLRKELDADELQNWRNIVT